MIIKFEYIFILIVWNWWVYFIRKIIFITILMFVVFYAILMIVLKYFNLMIILR